MWLHCGQDGLNRTTKNEPNEYPKTGVGKGSGQVGTLLFGSHHIRPDPRKAIQTLRQVKYDIQSKRVARDLHQIDHKLRHLRPEIVIPLARIRVASRCASRCENLPLRVRAWGRGTKNYENYR